MSFWNKKQRFSIRKLSIGAVSVLLGVVMTIPLTSETVFAEEVEAQAALANQSGAGEVAPDAEESAETNQAYSSQAAETSGQETAAPADEQELMLSPAVPADKSDLLSLFDQARGLLSKEVSTAGEDPALVRSYEDFRLQLTNQLDNIQTTVLDNEDTEQSAVDQALVDLTSLLNRFQESIKALEESFATYYFYDEFQGSDPITVQVITENGSLVEPGTPTPPAGYIFLGWYYTDGDKAGQQVDFSEVLTAQQQPDYKVSIAAKYDKKVNVTYISEDIVQKTQQMDTGSQAPEESVTITTAGKIFKHWALTPNGAAYDFSQPVMDDITLYAVLDDKWKVTFDAAGGTPVDVELRDYNTALAVSGLTPERQGYDFKHWSLTPDGSPVDDTTIVSGDMLLYAVWETKKNTPYTVLYHYQNANDDGYSLRLTRLRTGETGANVAPDLSVITGAYTYKSSDAVTIAADGSTIVNVYVDRKKYQYAFYKSDQQTLIMSGQAKFGQDLSEIFRQANALNGNTGYAYWSMMGTAYVVHGYNFTMWSQDLNFAERPKVYEFKIHQYIIGEGLKQTITIGSERTTQDYLRNYSILGFTAQYTGSGTAAEKNGTSTGKTDFTLTAASPEAYIYYTRNSYELELVPNKKGLAEASVKQSIPFEAALPNPADLLGYVVDQTTYSHEGLDYVFKGWYDNTELFDFSAGPTMPAGNLRLEARWEALPLKVTVYHDEEKTQSSIIEVYKDNVLSQSEAMALLTIPEGYDMSFFKGWYKEVDGVMVPFDFTSPIQLNETIIPVWNPVLKQVRYQANGGTGSLPQSGEQLLNSSYLVLSGKDLTNSQRQFIGWNTAADGSGQSYRPGDILKLTDDVTLYAQWSQPKPLTIATENRTVTEGQQQSAQKVLVASAIPYVVTAGPLPATVSGLTMDSSGILSGRPVISDWADDEDSRTISIPVTVTSGNESVTGVVLVTIQRDTDGDGQPDLVDADDDNDGISDSSDRNPKTADTVAPVIQAADAVVTEKAPITPILVTVTDNDDLNLALDSSNVSGLPDGLAYNSAIGQIEGTPVISDWDPAEESRDFPVTITVTDGAGNQATTTLTVTVQRDTDGDGQPDLVDADDDNDGIPDVTDKNQKTADTAAPVIQAADATVTEKAPIAPISVTVTDNDDLDLTLDPSDVTGLPAGLAYNPATGQIEGTPVINDWGPAEESRDFSVTITVTDGAGNQATTTLTITVQRDTDGDGQPDLVDADDDNDGIPDVTDKNPKTADTAAPVIQAADATVTEKTPIAPIPVTVTDNDDLNLALDSSNVSGLPAGLAYNSATGQIEGTPVINDWGPAEESRDFPVTITVTDGAGNQAVTTVTITVQRDTDGDGQPDLVDSDDDNDGIPDVTDKNPKITDTAAPVIQVADVTVTEKAPIAPISVTVTDNDDLDLTLDPSDVIGLPAGLAYNPVTNQIEGTPAISDWGSDEESRDFPVILTVTDGAGNQATTTLTITVQRDTDGDGISDIDDSDDDNDGIPDTSDRNPKIADTVAPVIQVADTTVTEKAPIAPIPVTVTDNDDPNLTLDPADVAGLPVGLAYNPATGQIEGTPTISDWGSAEEYRDFSVTITVTDGAGNQATATLTITVQRDTDGDGISDIDDSDDDNDGIPDSTDRNPKIADTLAPVIQAADATVTEKAPVAPIPVTVTDNDDPNLTLDPSAVTGLPAGLVYNPTTGQIEGTPVISDWEPVEESRDFPVTITVTDGAGNQATTTLTITVQRDTDGDGQPDLVDVDDDNDGIPDVTDKNPKTADTAAPVIQAADTTVTEKAPIAPIPVAVTDNDDLPLTLDPSDVTGLPAGLVYNPATGQIEGTPVISDWDPAEESRDFPVTLAVTDGAGNQATKTVTITVQRDTDGDGEPDLVDADDDNDGIPDVTDKNPKTVDTAAPVIQTADATVTEKAPIVPIPVTVTDNDDENLIIDSSDVTGLPAGLAYNPVTGQIEGTPTISDWGPAEESRDFPVTVTVTDGAGNQATTTLTITVQRDTDGDGQPDLVDADDDNDGIPDSTDRNPKIADTLAPVIQAADATVTEKAPITPIPVTVTDNDDPNLTLDPSDVIGLPAGLAYNPATGQIEGTPVISDWGSAEESRDFSVTITVTDGAGNQATTTLTITVQRDTDGDGQPDLVDADDDNDGIPDTADRNPKTADTAAPVIQAPDAIVTEKTVIVPVMVTATDNDDQTLVLAPSDVTGLPAGLAYNPATGQIEGTPVISDWGPS